MKTGNIMVVQLQRSQSPNDQSPLFGQSIEKGGGFFYYMGSPPGQKSII